MTDPPRVRGAEDRTPVWAVLQHVAHEGPGRITAALGAAGQPLRIVRLDQGAALPEVEELGGLVVLGGPMGVHDEAAHPWLVAERDLLRQAVALDLPILGVCLGAQQLALALGAEVTTGDRPEIGVGHVELTAAGRRDPVFGPEYRGLSGTTVRCVHWHQDTFTLPEGAVHLAASRPFPHQAFRLGSRIYGLQFHIEVDDDLARAWHQAQPESLALESTEVAEVTAVGDRLLRRFVSVAASRDLADVPGDPSMVQP